MASARTTYPDRQGGEGRAPAAHPFVWVSLRDPSPDELAAVQREFGLPAAHRSSPSQDPELGRHIDGLADHLPATVALHQYRDRDGVSDRCAADHAAMGTAGGPPVKVLVRLVLGLGGFGPRHTSSLPDDPSLPEL